MDEKLKVVVIRIGGCLISLITLLWMPWTIRVYWAKIVYQLTYIDPRKYPVYMKFIEQTNDKYQMGKRTKNSYKNIVQVKESHIKNEKK